LPPNSIGSFYRETERDETERTAHPMLPPTYNPVTVARCKRAYSAAYRAEEAAPTVAGSWALAPATHRALLDLRAALAGLPPPSEVARALRVARTAARAARRAGAVGLHALAAVGQVVARAVARAARAALRRAVAAVAAALTPVAPRCPRCAALAPVALRPVAPPSLLALLAAPLVAWQARAGPTRAGPTVRAL